MHDFEKLTIRPSTQDQTAQEYFHNAAAQRISTDAVIHEALKAQYPDLHLITVPEGQCNLLNYAAAGHAFCTPMGDASNDPAAASTSLKWRRYAPPAKRLDNEPGALVDQVLFGKYLYGWKSHEFVLYVIDGRDGSESYPRVRNNYILSKDEQSTNELIVAASRFMVEVHNDVLVFDQGYWQKNAELWKSVQKASWEDVILDESMKKSIIGDVMKFFDSRDSYEKLSVPWKRGIIYWGPPGNGKTVSIKAMMHSLYSRKDPVPTLYVRNLVSYGGPEFALSLIFTKARETAPCYLVFEDLDSIVTDQVRSYFLNEVDGLQNNDGILMIGSTNHLERLDPGISKRPSRFDRKYLFPDPNFEQRVQYCKFWQGKLSDNENIEFPDELCAAIAKITDKFSFAYIQEAFVAALLAIAAEEDEEKTTTKKDDELDKYLLWRQIKKQVQILREEIEEKGKTVKRVRQSHQSGVYRIPVQ